MADHDEFTPSENDRLTMALQGSMRRHGINFAQVAADLIEQGWRKADPTTETGMDHVGWACRHNPDDPEDVHTQWQPRRRKPGWKRKKLPGYVSSMSGLEWRPDAPTEPGCLAARPVYSPKGSSDA